jgi:hypothetical protein
VGRELLARAADVARTGVDPWVSGDRPAEPEPAAPQPADVVAEVAKAARSSPAERRVAARALLETWGAVARDLAVVAAGGRERAVDLALIEDLETAAGLIRPGAAPAFLARLARCAELLDANANPELVVDVLVLAWPDAA